MRRDTARSIIIIGSLATTSIMMLFFILAPSLGYRMEGEDAVKAAETAVPPFVGYLGAAVGYVLGKRSTDGADVDPNLGVLIVGPLVFFIVAFVALVVAFSNGENTELFQGWLTAILSIVTLTVGVASQKLFGSAESTDGGNV